MKKKDIKIILSILIVLVSVVVVFCYTEPIKNGELEDGKEKYKEADYVNAFCNGQIEYVLPDKTRVDCLTDEYAIEFDWAKKWAEGAGQSLYYAKMTNKKPAVAIIIKSPKDKKYIERIKKIDPNIKVFIIKAKEYKE